MKADGLEWMFRLSMLAFLLGSIGVVMFNPSEISTSLWLVIGLSAMLGLTGMLGAIATKLLIFLVRVED